MLSGADFAVLIPPHGVTATQIKSLIGGDIADDGPTLEVKDKGLALKGDKLGKTGT